MCETFQEDLAKEPVLCSKKRPSPAARKPRGIRQRWVGLAVGIQREPRVGHKLSSASESLQERRIPGAQAPRTRSPGAQTPEFLSQGSLAKLRSCI